KGAGKARIILEQSEYKGESYNVVAELPGETDEWIVINAHYDTTELSTGAYDNMSGCIGVLGIAEAFCGKRHRYGLRFIWHGSEERGLIGSKAYCMQHEAELEKIVLNINMDMIGCIMGRFAAICTAEEKLVHYIQYMAAEMGVGIEARDGVRSSDSTPFADKGIPAVSFARYAPAHTAMIHNRYDTWKVMSPEQLIKDIAFITEFIERMANAKECPVAREIPEKMREKIDIYLNRKREK
ncbi:MAG: Zn-dependent exopeptidase M28, partial [Lachnospiraceae bacterium]|nr:Zn-dependent exopeptidase M28 [Lachnospiraceae bacterium]